MPRSDLHVSMSPKNHARLFFLRKSARRVPRNSQRDPVTAKLYTSHSITLRILSYQALRPKKNCIGVTRPTLKIPPTLDFFYFLFIIAQFS